jgi:hypothetical protein
MRTLTTPAIIQLMKQLLDALEEEKLRKASPRKSHS